MKIILVSFLARGGMIHYASQIANALVRDNDVTIFLPDHADISYFSEKINFFFIHVPPNPLKTLYSSFNLLSHWRMIKEISSISPDVIHILSTHPWNNLICFFLKPSIKVFTHHDPIPHEQTLLEKIRLFKPIILFDDRMAINWADKVIVHGETLKNQCISIGIPNEKLATIKIGDFGFFTKGLTQIKNNNKIILFFGRIEPYKGLNFFLEAIISLNKRNTDLHYIIAGEGNLKPYKLLINQCENIEIINRYISDEEIFELFSKSSVVVLPYISATQSGIIPIAYAFKVPVIASNVGAIAEVIENGVTGILVPPRNSDSIASAIEEIMSDENFRILLGRNAYNKMKKELSWEKIADETLNLYSAIKIKNES